MFFFDISIIFYTILFDKCTILFMHMTSNWEKTLSFNISITDWTDVYEFSWVKRLTSEAVNKIIGTQKISPHSNDSWEIVDWSSLWVDFVNETISLKVAQEVFLTNKEIWRLILKNREILNFSYSIKK